MFGRLHKSLKLFFFLAYEERGMEDVLRTCGYSEEQIRIARKENFVNITNFSELMDKARQIWKTQEDKAEPSVSKRTFYYILFLYFFFLFKFLQ